MKNKAYTLSLYPFSTDEQIVVDANIWLYLFPPPGNPQASFAKSYSHHFTRMIKAGAKPVLDPMVMSEYLNRYCRIEWHGRYETIHSDFKKFRQSADFNAVGTSAAAFAKKILSMSSRHTAPSNEIDIQQALDDFSTGAVDFNDAVLADICKKQGFKLMTNDADFQSGGIEVLTTNPKLLQVCS